MQVKTIGKTGAGLALAALVALGPRPAAAQNVPLINPGFELPTAGSPPGFTNDDITGWTGTVSYSQAYGVQLYDGTDVTAPPDGGSQFGYVNDGSIYQDTTVALTAGDTYVFTAEVGYRNDEPSTVQSSLDLLTSSGTPLATSGLVTPSLGTFAPYSVSYTANDPTLYGQTLRVQLTQGNPSAQSDFDNADLTIVPEPSTLVPFALAGLGLGGLMLRARRRKASAA